MSGWIDSSGVITKWAAVHAGMTAAEGKIDAAALADAAMSIISIFDLISGMGTAKGDMEGNAKTVAKYGAEKGGPIQDIVATEIAADPSKLKKLIGDGKTATCALLWLVRALTFIEVMVGELMSNREKEMKDCVNDGYAASLKPHHGMMIKTIFAGAVKMAPNRATFEAKLDATADAAFAKIGGLMPQFSEVLAKLREFLVTSSIESK